MIYGDRNTGLLVQGATGKQGEFHIGLMNAYAKQVGGNGVVAGVTPGKGGQQVHGVPVYNTVKEAMKEHDIGAAVIFVPAGAAADAIMEEANAGITTIVCITEHIPVQDTMKAIAYARMEGASVIGPNCPGLLSPGEVKMGIMPAGLFSRGNVGVISRSGTLTYEVVDELSRAGIGQRYRGRHRRRPGHRADVRGRPGAVREGSADQGGRPDWGGRRESGRGGCNIHQPADRLLHCRCLCPTG